MKRDGGAMMSEDVQNLIRDSVDTFEIMSYIKYSVLFDCAMWPVTLFLLCKQIRRIL